MHRVIFPVMAVVIILAQAYRAHGVTGQVEGEWMTLAGVPQAERAEALPLMVGGHFIKPVYSLDEERLDPFRRALL